MKKEQVFIGTCRFCNHEVEILDKDTLFIRHDGNDRATICPICYRRIELNKKENEGETMSGKKCKCGGCGCNAKTYTGTNMLPTEITQSSTSTSYPPEFTGQGSAMERVNWSDPDEYYKDLKKRQEEHLKGVFGSKYKNWQPCLHEQCPECVGTGIKKDGSMCIHMISCSCPKCSPQCIC